MEEGKKRSSKAVPRESLNRVNRLFRHFSNHYGAQRMSAHWQGNDPDEVKAYWAFKLKDTSHRGVVYAMANLPMAFPPTVDEFIAIARQAPEPYVVQLEHVESAEERQARKAAGAARIAELRAKLPYLNKPIPEVFEDEEARL
jgi:hypothetical protein